MKIKSFLCAVFAATLLGSCSYDDGGLWDAVNGQEERISALEKWQKTVVEQLNSLQGILTATDYITDVEKVTKEDGTEGYKISFLHAAPITLYYNNDNEVSGTGSEAISVAQEEGTGKWYWTLDGEPLQIDGKTVYVSGNDNIQVEYNADGTVKLTIGDNVVLIPETPVVHPVTSVTEKDNIVTVTLNGGASIELSKYLNLGQFLEDAYNGKSQTVSYPLTLPEGCIVKVLDELPSGWNIAITKSETVTSMEVTYPSEGKIDVTFLISDGRTQTIMKSVAFDAGAEAGIVWTNVTYNGTDPIIVAPGTINIKVAGDAKGLASTELYKRIIEPIKLCAGIVNVDLSEVTCNTQFPTNAFYANTPLNPDTDKNTTMETFVMPKGIVAVWAKAFKNCVALKSVTIPTKPSGNMSYFDECFAGCTALESIFVPEGDVETFKSSWTVVAQYIKPISE